ncbi:hypothetical protein GGS26DRAFT_536539 [Hypomontagnella submonticulosa]|nr:hypothetical protein GGS26DRAFT_536539 [Hypomontagnella submonticulosa]
MFEVPDAKRVRREDLRDSASDEEATEDDQWDSALRGKLNARLSGLLDLSFATDGDTEAQKPSESQTGDGNEGSNVGVIENTGSPKEEAFTFRLFRDEEPSRKVILKPQNVEGKNGDGGFIVAKRPLSYYVAGEPSPESAKEFRMAAVSADYLLQDAKKRRWGLEKPWKVKTIAITINGKIPPTGSSASDNVAAESGKPKKRRPCKKRRIILRIREKAKKEQAETAKQQLVDKEQHLKDKKKRLNRQKKLKRRAKEREKKQGIRDDAASEQSSRNASPTQE